MSIITLGEALRVTREINEWLVEYLDTPAFGYRFGFFCFECEST